MAEQTGEGGRPRRRVARRQAGPPTPAAGPAPEAADPSTAPTPPTPEAEPGLPTPGRRRQRARGPRPGQPSAEPAGESAIDAVATPVSDESEAERSAGVRPRPGHPESGHADPGHAESGQLETGHGGSPAAAPRTRPDAIGDRALRALVSTRATQLTPTAALRAREVGMPSAEDLAAAERDLVIVRRHYQPPTPLTAGRRRRAPRQPD